MRWVVLVVTASACGRFGFDARDSASDGSLGGDAARDAHVDAVDSSVDAAPDAPPLPLAIIQASPLTQSAGGTLTATLPAASSAGNLLVAAVASNDPTSLSMPAGWQMTVQMFTSGNCASTIFAYPDNPGGISNVMVTINAGVPLDVVVAEFQGIRTTTPIADVAGMASSGTPVTSQTVSTPAATAAAGELAIAMFCEDVNTPAYTGAGGSWISLASLGNASSKPSFNVDYQLSVPMAVVSETVTSSVGGKYQGALATFRPQ